MFASNAPCLQGSDWALCSRFAPDYLSPEILFTFQTISNLFFYVFCGAPFSFVWKVLHVGLFALQIFL